MNLDRTSSGFDVELHVGAAFFLELLRAELRLAQGADGTTDLRGPRDTRPTARSRAAAVAAAAFVEDDQ